MINIRESEIREEALLLTIATYEVVGNLLESTTLDQKNKLIDESFLVSSLIAEAFKTKQNEGSEQDLEVGLIKLIELNKQAESLRDQCSDNGISLDNFLHLALELQVELTELHSAMKQINSESYSPKLETTCI